MSLSEIHIIGDKTQELLVGADLCPALRAAGVRLCGVSEARAPYRMGRPSPDFTEVLVVLSGEGRVWLEGEGWRTVGAGDAYLAPCRKPQGFAPSPGRRWRFAWVHFFETPEGVEPAVGQGCATVARRTGAEGEALAEAIRRLHAELLGANEAPMIVQLVGWVQLCAKRIARGTEARRGDERLRRLWARVDAELAAPWTLESLASAASLSGEHLRRLCRREHGRSPMAELARLRMRRAALLLRGTPLKAEAIAEAVGYGSVYSFSAAFRRELGMPPSAWRSGLV